MVMSFKVDFPQTSFFTYLDTASVGLLPKQSVEDIKRFLELEEIFGSVYWPKWEGKVDELRKLTAKLIDASAEEIALTSNTSYGLNIVANGIDWRRGENIVLNDLEFPANVFPWQNQAKINGLEVKIARNINGEIPVEEYEKLVDDKTRILAVSWVEYSNGFKHDLKTLAEIAHSHGALLVVDGIQGIGSLKLSVSREKIDLLSCGCSKWLISPIGTGFLYVKKQLLGELKTTFIGWRSDVDFLDFTFREFKCHSSARRFEIGSPNFIGLHGMLASVKYILKVGLDRIEEKNLSLAEQLVNYLRELKLKTETPLVNGAPQSSIVSFKTSRVKELHEKLTRNRIVTSIRSGAIRVSPHFYNDEEDVEKLITVIKQLI